MRPEVQSLFLVTLTLEEALRAEDWESVEALMNERERLLRELEGVALGVEDRGRLDTIQDAEQRIVLMLNESRREIISSLSRSRDGRKMMQAYSAA